MCNRVIIFSLFLFSVFSLQSFLAMAQEASLTKPLNAAFREKTFVVGFAEQAFALADSFIVIHSDRVLLGNTLLRRDDDYRIDYFNAMLFPLTGVAAVGDTLRIFYQRLALPLRREYAHRRIQMLPPDATTPGSGNPTATQAASRYAVPNLGADLQKSGSLVRGVSLGTNQALKVDSGLRLQVSGKVSEGIEVVAALTDQNTPIQPEGNTQTLQEIDKVFVRLDGQQFDATLGDYEIGFSGTEFARYQRKLQGAMTRVQRGPAQITLSGAVSRGKYRSQQLAGIEGNQGPYQLTGDRGQIDIIVLAGTERLWLDGVPMVRGENNDYVIEYGNGQITFTRNRLITGDSRITVDFQYSDERFQRNLYSMEAQVQALDDRLQIRSTLLREGDDKDNPLDLTLTDATRAALAAAGDSLATIDGASLVGADKGSYIRRDSIFVYVGADSGDYLVRFSDLGAGRGSYSYAGFGHYVFAGTGRGRYAPVVILPKAQRNSLADFRMNFSAIKGLDIVSEIALSNFDGNLYSPRDDQNNDGQAYLFEVNFAPENLAMFGQKLGKGQIRFRHRVRNDTYREIDRDNVVEFGRRWDLQTESAVSAERISEAEVRYEPWKKAQFFGSVGTLSRPVAKVSSARWEAGTTWARKSFPDIDYHIENISRQNADDPATNSWLRQRGSVQKRIWHLRPLVEVEKEVKKDVPRDTLRSGFRLTRLTTGLGLENWHKIDAEVQVSRRVDDDRVQTTFVRQSAATTQSYKLGVKGWHNLIANATYTHRERDYSDALTQDTRTDLAEVRVNYALWQRAVQTDAQYQITNTQVSRQERVYFKVNAGEGNYIYNKDLNEYVQDPFGDYILRLVPTDDFIPVVELRSRLNLRIRPALMLSTARPSRWQKVVAAFSSETLVRVEEKTRDPQVREIYLFNFSHYQNPAYSLFGNMSLRQDVFLFENRRDFSLRYRLTTGKDINNQFLDGEQRHRQIRHEARLDLAFSRKTVGQFEIIRAIEDKTFKVSGRQDRLVRSWSASGDISYRPVQRLEVAMRTLLGRDRDLAPTVPTVVDQISFKPRSTYAFRGKGRFRGELEWTKVTATPANAIIPYELAQGYRVGNTFRWNVDFEYRLSNNLNSSFSYQGRAEPERPRTIHIAKIEMRAFF